MLIARWTIDAHFGRKDAAVDLMRRWWRDIAPEIGWSTDQLRILTGSVGAAESRIEVEVILEDLAALDRAWSRLGALPAQGDWADELAPHIISGSARWTVLRIL